jgi:hypothetical protein
MSNECGIKCTPLLLTCHVNKEKTTGRRRERKTKNSVKCRGGEGTGICNAEHALLTYSNIEIPFIKPPNSPSCSRIATELKILLELEG